MATTPVDGHAGAPLCGTEGGTPSTENNVSNMSITAMCSVALVAMAGALALLVRVPCCPLARPMCLL